MVIKSLPKVRDFFSKKTYLLFILLILLLVMRDPLVFGSMSYLCLNITIANTKWYSTISHRILLDIVVINGHWDRDLDLKCLWCMVKCLSMFLLLCSYRVVYNIYLLGEVVDFNFWVSDQFIALKFWGELWIGVFLVINGLLFSANMPIIWFRNIPVREKILATCVNCVKFGVVALPHTKGVKKNDTCMYVYKVKKGLPRK